jgi:hypothetical protein
MADECVRRLKISERLIVLGKQRRCETEAALAACLTEHAEREGRKQAAAAATERERFFRALLGVPLPPRRDPATGIDTVSLLRRIELLEQSNAMLAAKVAKVSRKKKRSR